MLARVKLKGIDGTWHKWWILWFNLMLRGEPYQDLTSQESPRNRRVLLTKSLVTGGAWLSSARAVRSSRQV